MTLSEYLKQQRGRAAAVAVRAGVSEAFLSQIAAGTRNVPAERAAELEAACDGAVRRWDLRPDDWHRIWPELIGAEGAPEVPALATEANDAG